MLALAEALRNRGHTVALETWARWREPVEAATIEFFPAPEYHVFPTRERPMKPYEAAALAARTTRTAIRRFSPDAVVADILTAAPALAGELEGLPVATLVPHVHPELPPGFPPYSIGARLPRTRLGAAFWRRWDRLVAIGLERGRREYNDCRGQLGLPPLPYVHSALSRSLTLVATLPVLEYPRAWPPWVRIVGPLMWEPPGERVDPPPSPTRSRDVPSSSPRARDQPRARAPRRPGGLHPHDDPAPSTATPVVLIAPSTSQDPGHRLLRAALAGLADEPVRVIATGTSREPDPPLPVPANAVVVAWLSYSKTMPLCDVVVCHGGHGTLMHALTNGCPVVVCPAGGDMAENAARVDWAGVGVRLAPRFCTPWGVRLAVRRALSLPRLRDHAAAAARWAAEHPAGPTAAVEVERWAAGN
jgi:UDP:flavonoid glycosyltransferase YjiC (YdhE family)